MHSCGIAKSTGAEFTRSFALFLTGSARCRGFIRFGACNMPVVPKTVCSSRRQSGWVRDDVHRKTKTSQRPQMLMCSTQTPSLTQFRFCSAKGRSCCQHTVENNRHVVRYRHDPAFRPPPHCQSGPSSHAAAIWTATPASSFGGGVDLKYAGVRTADFKSLSAKLGAWLNYHRCRIPGTSKEST